jgi:ubiquitin-conjugating enzyme E2 D
MNRLMRRLRKETEECRLMEEDHPIRARPIDPANLKEWEAFMKGPDNSPYEGYVYHLAIDFPQDYPLSPPLVYFKMPMFHPNISTGKTGSICLDILKDKWSPVLTLPKVLLSIMSLLTDPNPDSPLNSKAARYWKATNKENYYNKVKELGEEYALRELPPN